MIISKFVNVKATGKLIKKFNCKNLDIIKINIEDLSNGSHSIVEVECDFCKIICNVEYRQYIKQLKTIKKYTCDNSKCISLKIKEIHFVKYNGVHPSSLAHVKEKIKQTNLKRYGVENAGWTLESQSKIKQTNLEKYGVENAGWTLESQSKIKQTNLEKYGVEYSSQSNLVRNKIKETNLERYGVEYPSTLDSVKDKMKKTNLERYGVEYPSKLDVFKNKMKKTNLERYGAENYSQSDDFIHKYKKSLSIKEYNGYNYQSRYELDFLKFCEVHNIIISNHTPSIIYYIGNKKHRYYPDFFYEKHNLIIEIKSTYWYNKHLVMNQEKEKQTILDGYNYIIIMDKNYEEFLQKIN